MSEPYMKDFGSNLATGYKDPANSKANSKEEGAGEPLFEFDVTEDQQEVNENSTKKEVDGESITDDKIRYKAPWPQPPIIDLRGREVIFAIGCLFLLSVCLGLIIIMASGNTYGQTTEKRIIQKDNEGICISDHCVKTAGYLLENMNPNVNPCDDFFQYACGGWLDTHFIPSAYNSWSVDHEIKVQIENTIREIVENPIEKNTRDSSERKVKIFFDKCMDLHTIDGSGKKTVMDQIDRLGGWSLLDNWEPIRWSLQLSLQELAFTYYLDGLFSFWVAADENEVDKDIIQIDQGYLAIERNSYKKNTSDHIVKAYKEYIADIGRAFNFTNREVERFVSRTWEFEKQLAMIQGSDNDMASLDIDLSTTTMTLGEFQRTVPIINWLTFFKRNFTKTKITSNTKIAVSNLNYFKNITKLVDSTPSSTLNNYIIWKFLINFASELSKPFRLAAQKFENAVKGSTKGKDRWRYCLDMLDDWMGIAVGAMFVEKHFPKESKSYVLDMIGYIKGAFLNRLQDLDWMDNSTKKAAIEKLEVVDYRIGFPEYILNKTKVDLYYKYLHINEEDSYFENTVNCIHKQVKDMVDIYEKTSGSEDGFDMNPHEVNAYFSPSENAIVFPAGILQKPYFVKNAPHYINYGGIGATIGHELVHGFDLLGARYDKDGNYDFWWSDTSWQLFENKTNCLVNFYSNFTLQGLKVDGHLTATENIADVGGLIQTYYGYKAWEEKNGEELKLPGLGLNNEQAFFLAFGQNWCTKRRLKSLRNMLLTDPHAPSEIRVKGSLTQLPEFAEAFNCKSDTKMNPPNKCSMW